MNIFEYKGTQFNADAVSSLSFTAFEKLYKPRVPGTDLKKIYQSCREMSYPESEAEAEAEAETKEDPVV